MNFIQVDPEGYLNFSDKRVTDEDFGSELLQNLKLDETNNLISSFQNDQYLVEAYDEPLVAKQVFKQNSNWEILVPYGVRIKFSLEKLCVDDWDRFHGVTESGVPFVFSREAQAEFFRLVDELKDDSIIVDKKEIPIPFWYRTNPEVNRANFWTNIYQTEEPGWDMKGPSPVLVNIVPKLKLTKQRILVLGCGEGHDAAYFAESGHIVTAIDFSAEAISRAKKRYGHLTNLRFFEFNVFNLPENWTDSFDLIFEHTCYCAVDPLRRKELTKVWKRLLVPGGHLLGIFFAMYKPVGPPFGGTEYEIHERLKKDFRFLYWLRTKASHPRRLGRELVVYAEKL